jgi:hypothetical protein
MSTIELKEILIGKINNTEDEDLLEHMALLFDFESKNDGVYILSPDEVAAVKDGIDQIDQGMAISNDEARKIFDKCLGK